MTYKNLDNNLKAVYKAFVTMTKSAEEMYLIATEADEQYCKKFDKGLITERSSNRVQTVHDRCLDLLNTIGTIYPVIAAAEEQIHWSQVLLEDALGDET